MSYCFHPHCQNPQNPAHAVLCQSCGSELRLKNRYRVIKILGQSQVSRTFLAVDEDKPLLPRCIIKQGLHSNETPCDQNSSGEGHRFYATELDKISKHPRIPDLLASFEENGYQYLVQEYIPGRNLADELAQDDVFREVQIWQLLSEVLPVIQFVHNNGLIHGDIKPENIIRRSATSSAFASQTEGNLILVDFGRVIPYSDTVSMTPEQMGGSAEYAAPEQTTGQLRPNSDLYSLGVTCLYLLTQVSPFDLFDVKSHTWTWRHFLKKPVSSRLGRLLDKLVERNPAKRYQTAAQVLHDLKYGPSPVPAVVSSQQKWMLTAWGGAALALLSMLVSSRLPSPFPQASSVPPEPVYHIPDIRFNEPPLYHKSMPRMGKGPAVTTLHHNIGPVWSIAVTPTGEFVATGNTDGSINLMDVKTGQVLNTLSGHSGPVGTLAISPDGRTLVSGSGDNSILVWDLWSGRLEKMLYGHQGWVYAVAVSPDGQTIASVSRDQTIRLWNIHTGKLLRTLQGYAGDVQAIAFSPDNQTLVCGGSNGIIELWDWHQGQLIRTLQGHSDAIWAVAVSPDGQTLATGSWDQTIKLWNLQELQSQYFNPLPQDTLIGHTDKVQSLTFSPDGDTLASGDFAGTVKLWQIHTGGLMGTLKGHKSWVEVEFLPQGNGLISGSFDDTVKVWRLSSY